jgi:hypothetical protein
VIPITSIWIESSWLRSMGARDAVELVLGEGGSEQIMDILKRPSYYVEIVREMRRHLSDQHSFDVRAEELVRICDERPREVGT